MITYFWIAIGSALGGMSRYACSRAIAVWFGETFPWGTLAVNVSGCLVIGFFAALTGPDGRAVVAPDLRQFVMVGFLGGYTTFSSFSLQTLDLIRNRDFAEAGANVLLSVIVCMIAVWLGWVAAAFLNATRSAG
ncbi:MAG: fluoride efflux transporter CrcB [Sphingomonadales bacterium]